MWYEDVAVELDAERMILVMIWHLAENRLGEGAEVQRMDEAALSWKPNVWQPNQPKI